jgi:hypothetical protein
MDGLEFVIDAVKRFRLAEKEISVWLQIVVIMLNNLGFGWSVKIDEHIGADNDIETLHEHHAGIVKQVQVRERYLLPDFR